FQPQRGLAHPGRAPGGGRQGRSGTGDRMTFASKIESRNRSKAMGGTYMKRWLGMPVAGALLLSACVTINVYFPAAEAKEAAREFVEKVINEADKVELKDPSAPAGG